MLPAQDRLERKWLPWELSIKRSRSSKLFNKRHIPKSIHYILLLILSFLNFKTCYCLTIIINFKMLIYLSLLSTGSTQEDPSHRN